MKHFPPILLFLFLFSFNASAQFEIKSNPISLIFLSPSIAAEYGFNDNFGLELYGFVIADAGGLAYLSGKYYLNPREGLDRFNIGAFLAAGDIGIGAGFQLGTKIVAQKGLLFEFGIGVGRGFTEAPFLPYLKLDLGYRFKKKIK